MKENSVQTAALKCSRDWFFVCIVIDKLLSYPTFHCPFLGRTFRFQI